MILNDDVLESSHSMGVEGEQVRPKLLVIETTPIGNSFFRAVFGAIRTPFEPIIVDTPDEGFSFLEKNTDQVEVVILGHDLLGMDASIATGNIRKISGRPDKPYVLWLRGKITLEDSVTGRASGIDEIIPEITLSPTALADKLNQIYEVLKTPKE